MFKTVDDAEYVQKKKVFVYVPIVNLFPTSKVQHETYTKLIHILQIK